MHGPVPHAPPPTPCPHIPTQTPDESPCGPTPQVQEEVNSTSAFVDIKFSNDGKYIMGVVEGKVYVLDAFNGNVVRRIANGVTEGATPMEASISADNKYVLQGEVCRRGVWREVCGRCCLILQCAQRGYERAWFCVRRPPLRVVLRCQAPHTARACPPLARLRGPQHPGVEHRDGRRGGDVAGPRGRAAVPQVVAAACAGGERVPVAGAVGAQPGCAGRQPPPELTGLGMTGRGLRVGRRRGLTRL
jgi:hypothetical protein